MSVDIQLLKQLREITFAPLKDCKEALIESNGDLEQAQELLRKKGISKAWSKADRETKEWLVKLVEKDWWIAGLKILCETDFVAKSDTFQEIFSKFLDKLLNLKKEVMSKEELDESVLSEMDNELHELVGKLWENMKIWEVIITNKNAYMYNHPGNKVASVVFYEGNNPEVAKEVALQVTAMNPTYVSYDQVPEEYRNKLAEEYREELLKSGKPEAMINQILDWKLKKTLADQVLLEQEYIRDWAKKVREVLPSDFKVVNFIRISVF